MILLSVAESRVLVHQKGICLSWDCFQMVKKMRLGFIPSCSREKVVGKNMDVGSHITYLKQYTATTIQCRADCYLAASFWFPGKSQDDLQLSHPFTLFIEARRTFWETNVIKLIVIYSQLNWKKISCLAAFAAK